MRITNKIMQNNSLRNINTNKELQDKLNTQMATGEKVTRPSDDPVIAIRSLRLSTNLTKIIQYKDKNAGDADSWMFVTEDAVTSAEEVVKQIYDECVRGSDDEMNTSNYMALLETVKHLRDEFYSNGDAECAGQNLFTGYRTESKLMFQTNETLDYKIKQTFTQDAIQTRTYIDTTRAPQGVAGEVNDLMEYTEANGFDVVETDVESQEFKRIRLAYDNLKELDPNKDTIPVISYTDVDGSDKTIALTSMKSTDAGAYAPGDDVAYLLTDTGEIILGKNVVTTMSALPNVTEFSIEYEKTDWSKGDLRPEHYFDCKITRPGPTGPETLDYESGSRQAIRYDLGYNQSLQVNTAADEVFVHDLGRDVDDLEVLINRLDQIDGIVNSLEAKKEKLADAELAEVELQLAAAKKAQALVKDQVQKTFGMAMTSMQGYQKKVNLALTSIGTRGARLDLISNRLSSQQDTFEELLVKNNHKEIEESTTELASAKLTYDAALSATSQILKTSLMNYI